MEARTTVPDPLSLDALGVAAMTPDELAQLVDKLYQTASWVAEYRYLQLERHHRLLEGIPNRLTIGHYLHLRNKKSA